MVSLIATQPPAAQREHSGRNRFAGLLRPRWAVTSADARCMFRRHLRSRIRFIHGSHILRLSQIGPATLIHLRFLGVFGSVIYTTLIGRLNNQRRLPYISVMKELLRTTDPTIIAFASALLQGEGYRLAFRSTNMSVLEGGNRYFPPSF